MRKDRLPAWFLKQIKSIKGKRPKTVIDHILKHGFITTEELKVLYGYEHPPRAARDVRELGIPLETYRVRNKEGKSIGAYKFGELKKIASNKLSGRKIFSKQFKKRLIELLGAKCTISSEPYEERYSQVDHRIPYEIAGDDHYKELKPRDFMLLCASCNRAKSWSCEHCINWLEERDIKICKTCYWAYPEFYKHIALREIRRLDIVWEEHEIDDYEKLKERSIAMNITMPDFIKTLLKKHFN